MSLTRWTRGPRGLVVVAVGLVLLFAGPEPVVIGALRLVALALAVCGATTLVTRAGALDLATASAMAVGAYAGGVGTALAGVPVLLGVPAGALVGAAVGAVAGALHGRVGRGLGALGSLALGLAVVAALAAWRPGGGVAGFHAVGLLTPWGDRADLGAVGVLLLAGLAWGSWLAGSRRAAAAQVAVRAPTVAASLGRRGWADAAAIGAGAGALLGAGGASLAAVDGSVLPGAYGLELAAALALAAALGGAAPLGPVLGSVIVWGPGTLWPLAPLVGTGPPLLVMGPVGLALLAWRRGRPLVASEAPPVAVRAQDRPVPVGPGRSVTLEVAGADTPVGPADLVARPGEVVALVGPNGSGKSTLLARIAGQLPDGGAVRLDDAPAPRSATARARNGVARTWQRPPRLPVADALALVVADRPERAAAARWALGVLDAPADDPGTAQLVRLAAVAPAVALLDEPTDVAPGRLAAFVRGLADAGTAVVVVDHRPEIAAAADRVVSLGDGVAP